MSILKDTASRWTSNDGPLENVLIDGAVATRGPSQKGKLDISSGYGFNNEFSFPFIHSLRISRSHNSTGYSHYQATIYANQNNLFLLFLFVMLTAQDQKQSDPLIYYSNGYYYADKAQSRFYTGDYREFYENGTLKLEMQIRDGMPEGPYIVYFENRKPQEGAFLQRWKDAWFVEKLRPLRTNPLGGGIQERTEARYLANLG